MTVAVAVLATTGCRAPEPDTIVTLFGRDVEGLDPHAAGGTWQTQTVLANMYEGLVTLDPAMSLEPALAVSWSNPDDRTWVFQLRKGVRFHSGEALSAEDVVFSLRRARDHPVSVVRAALAGVEEISATPDGRVRLRTREPDAALTYRLREVFVVARRFVEIRGEAALGSASAGTGPYELAAYEPGRVVDLRRFDGYWQGAAAVARGRFVAFSYGDPRADPYVPPGAGLIFGGHPRDPELLRRALREGVPYTTPSTAVSYLAFDLRRARGNPFRDARVREAVALAIDRKALAHDLFGGEAGVATQLVAPPVLGYDPSLPLPRHDPEAARRLLAETPYAGGVDATLDVRASMRYGEVLRRDLAAIGIRLTVNELADEEFFDRVQSGRSELFVLRFSCRTGDAQEYFDKWLRSKDPASGYGQFNFSYDASPVAGLDARIDAARSELTPGPRLQLLRAIMRSAMAAHVAVPLLNEWSVVRASPSVVWTPRADTYRLFYEMRLAR